MTYLTEGGSKVKDPPVQRTGSELIPSLGRRVPRNSDHGPCRASGRSSQPDKVRELLRGEGRPNYMPAAVMGGKRLLLLMLLALRN